MTKYQRVTEDRLEYQRLSKQKREIEERMDELANNDYNDMYDQPHASFDPDTLGEITQKIGDFFTAIDAEYGNGAVSTALEDLLDIYVDPYDEDDDDEEPCEGCYDEEIANGVQDINTMVADILHIIRKQNPGEEILKHGKTVNTLMEAQGVLAPLITADHIAEPITVDFIKFLIKERAKKQVKKYGKKLKRKITMEINRSNRSRMRDVQDRLIVIENKLNIDLIDEDLASMPFTHIPENGDI